ncbi:hypothetical protein LXD69_08195 [Flavobacterium sediminilitoris]|uniref:Uncharacterized protein n=1 Tax=Flavobacterium sediminilitoris TaxID=2024526 RepID=A0ABY4HRJ5_9FLAO|nr:MULTISPECIES: hypothetical protein [Flavobacterium]UOX35490.1 hypothetical protein LXD69_08195 [Flavobacterium sediminilitoris]
MAIHKKAKNIEIIVKSDYNLTVGGKLEKITSKFNVEATIGNLNLISNKKIVSDGNKG